MSTADDIATFLAARFDEQEPSPGLTAQRDLVEWALRIETLRKLDDPAAPSQPFGEEALRVLASAYTRHPEFDPAWRLG